MNLRRAAVVLAVILMTGCMAMLLWPDEPLGLLEAKGGAIGLKTNPDQRAEPNFTETGLSLGRAKPIEQAQSKTEAVARVNIRVVRQDRKTPVAGALIYYATDTFLVDHAEQLTFFDFNKPWRHVDLEFLPSVQTGNEGWAQLKIAGAVVHLFAVADGLRGATRLPLQSEILNEKGYLKQLVVEEFESFAIQVLRVDHSPAIDIPVIYRNFRGTRTRTDEEGMAYIHLPQKSGSLSTRLDKKKVVEDDFLVQAPLLGPPLKRVMKPARDGWRRLDLYLPAFGRVEIHGDSMQLTSPLLLRMREGARQRFIKVEPEKFDGTEYWQFDLVPAKQPFEILLQEGDPAWEEGSLILTGNGPPVDGATRKLHLNLSEAFHFAGRLLSLQGEPLGTAEICAWLVDKRGTPVGGYSKGRTDAHGQLELFFHPSQFTVGQAKFLWLHTELPDWTKQRRPYLEYAIDLSTGYSNNEMQMEDLAPLPIQSLINGQVVEESGEAAVTAIAEVRACLRPSDFGREFTLEERWARPQVVPTQLAAQVDGGFAFHCFKRPFECDYELQVHDEQGVLCYRQVFRHPVKDVKVVLTPLQDVVISYYPESWKGHIDFFLINDQGQKFLSHPPYTGSEMLDSGEKLRFGRSKFEKLPPGNYRFQAVEKNQEVYAEILDVVIQSGETKPEMLQGIWLRQPGTIEIHLFLEDGTNLAGEYLWNAMPGAFRIEDGRPIESSSFWTWNGRFLLNREGDQVPLWLAQKGYFPQRIDGAQEGDKYIFRSLPKVVFEISELQQLPPNVRLRLEIEAPPSKDEWAPVLTPTEINLHERHAKYDFAFMQEGAYKISWQCTFWPHARGAEVRFPDTTHLLSAYSDAKTIALNLPTELTKHLLTHIK